MVGVCTVVRRSRPCCLLARQIWAPGRCRKDWIGGTVWYLDCELAEGYADLAPAPEPKVLPRLGPMVKGAQTTHGLELLAPSSRLLAERPALDFVGLDQVNDFLKLRFFL